MALTKDQWQAIGRHVANSVSSVTATLVIFKVITPADAATVGQSVASIITALAALIPIIVTLMMPILASLKSSPKAQIAAVNAGDNGVKVVPITAVGPVVNEPLK